MRRIGTSDSFEALQDDLRSTEFDSNGRVRKSISLIFAVSRVLSELGRGSVLQCERPVGARQSGILRADHRMCGNDPERML